MNILLSCWLVDVLGGTKTCGLYNATSCNIMKCSFFLRYCHMDALLKRDRVVPRNIIHHYNPKYSMDQPTNQSNIKKSFVK